MRQQGIQTTCTGTENTIMVLFQNNVSSSLKMCNSDMANLHVFNKRFQNNYTMYLQVNFVTKKVTDFF